MKNLDELDPIIAKMREDLPLALKTDIYRDYTGAIRRILKNLPMVLDGLERLRSQAPKPQPGG